MSNFYEVATALRKKYLAEGSRELKFRADCILPKIVASVWKNDGELPSKICIEDIYFGGGYLLQQLQEVLNDLLELLSDNTELTRLTPICEESDGPLGSFVIAKFTKN